jgi:hypothetical protein
MCEFLGSKAMLINSYYFTAVPSECQYVINHFPGTWALLTRSAFWVLPTNGEGRCTGGTIPVYRFSNNRQDFNQRMTFDLSVKRAMINRAWVPDGDDPNGTAFCSPI